MKITKFCRIRDYRIFRDFTWPDSGELPEFGAKNLIYGWNGSGKSTLSGILRALEKGEEIEEGVVELEIDGRRVFGDRISEYDDLGQVRVFNRQFVEENVFSPDPENDSVTPIFFVGQDSIEKEQQLDACREQVTTNLDALRWAEDEREDHIENMHTFLARHARIIKDMLRSGDRNGYNNYNRVNMRRACEKLLKVSSADRVAYRLSEDERSRLKALKDRQTKQSLSRISFVLTDVTGLVGRVGSVLKRTVVSDVITALKDDSELADWMKAGLDIHRKRKAESCLFCGQPLPGDRITELEAHFNKAYDEFISGIDTHIGFIQREKARIRNRHFPDPARLYDDLSVEYQKRVDELELSCERVVGILDTLLEELSRKKHRPFQEQVLGRIDTDVAVVDASGLNELIERHNTAAEHIKDDIDAARKQLEMHMAVGILDEYRVRKQDVTGIEDEIKRLNDSISQLKETVALLEEDIAECRRPAEQLTEDIRRYWGSDDISIETGHKGGGYRIMRGGIPAEHLSEGEKTAIAFLHFLKSLEDRDFDRKTGVVVIDDPVVSLDANALYHAFVFMEERTRDAGQLFVLTHSFPFFHQAKRWFRDSVRYYSLRTETVHGTRTSHIGELDPLLKDYETEYHYLFQLIYRAANNVSVTMEDCMLLPNAAKRLLEAFLAFRHPDGRERLGQQLQTLEVDGVDSATIMNIGRFLYAHSRYDRIGDNGQTLSISCEASGVLTDLLDLMRVMDPEHVERMERLCREYIPSA